MVGKFSLIHFLGTHLRKALQLGQLSKATMERVKRERLKINGQTEKMLNADPERLLIKLVCKSLPRQ